MPELNLTQDEAENLLAAEKHRVDDRMWSFADNKGKVIIPLVSPQVREEFLLDLWRGGIELRKGKYQNRVRKAVILARLDFGGAPHTNPDGEEFPCPHIHVYKEDAGTQWAYKLDNKLFPNTSDPWAMYDSFLEYCNITKPPSVSRLV